MERNVSNGFLMLLFLVFISGHFACTVDNLSESLTEGKCISTSKEKGET